MKNCRLPRGSTPSPWGPGGVQGPRRTRTVHRGIAAISSTIQRIRPTQHGSDVSTTTHSGGSQEGKQSHQRPCFCCDHQFTRNDMDDRRTAADHSQHCQPRLQPAKPCAISLISEQADEDRDAKNYDDDVEHDQPPVGADRLRLRIAARVTVTTIADAMNAAGPGRSIGPTPSHSIFAFATAGANR